MQLRPVRSSAAPDYPQRRKAACATAALLAGLARIEEAIGEIGR